MEAVPESSLNASQHFQLADMLAKAGKHWAAVGQYNAGLTLEPGNAEAWNNLGFLLRNLDRPDEAKYAFRKAIEIRPDWGAPWHNLAMVMSECGEF
jgi:Flp pilus assembly protein TadD